MCVWFSNLYSFVHTLTNPNVFSAIFRDFAYSPCSFFAYISSMAALLRNELCAFQRHTSGMKLNNRCGLSGFLSCPLSPSISNENEETETAKLTFLSTLQ